MLFEDGGLAVRKRTLIEEAAGRAWDPVLVQVMRSAASQSSRATAPCRMPPQVMYLCRRDSR